MEPLGSKSTTLPTFEDLSRSIEESQGKKLGKLKRTSDVIDHMVSQGFDSKDVKSLIEKEFSDSRIDLQLGSGKGIKIGESELPWISSLKSSKPQSSKPTEPSRTDIAKGSDTQELLQLTPSHGTGGEVEGNQWLPVNSQSGNVEGVYLDEGEAGVAPTIYVSFSGGNIYSYQQDDRMKKDPHQIVSDIMQQGGEAVWEDLRASQAKRSGHKPGEDMGRPKTGGSKRFAFVGSAHITDYKKERVGPVGQGLIILMKQTDILSSALRQRTTQLRERMKTTKGLGSKVSKGVGALMGMYSKAWKNDYPTTHPIIQRYNSISNAARELHKSKNTLYKLMDVSNDVLRVNSMHWGNSFSTSNPFIYANPDFPSGYAVEYQCPQSIQKLIGVSVPIWIQHKNSQRTEEEFVGTYNITGWDEQNGHEIATYDIDWDLVDEIFERERVENWIKPLRQQGKYPDTSTEYDCKLRYDRERAKFIQTDFNLIGLALVPQGNCSGTACAIKDT